MNIYDRIINMLLEARIEDYLDRLDEKLVGNQGKLDTNQNGQLDSQDFKMLRSRGKKMKRAVRGFRTRGVKS